MFLRTEEEQIQRAIKLKLHMFSRNQVLNNVDDEGFTIPQRVTEKFRECRLAKCHIKIEWWNERVVKHKLAGAITDGLAVPLQEEHVRRELDDAIRSAHEANPAKRSAGRILALLRHMGPCNRTELFGLCKASFESPSLSRSMSQQILPNLVKHFARCNMHNQEPDFWATLSPSFDSLMGESWSRAQGSGVARAAFLRANRGTLGLFFSMETATRAEAAASSPDLKPDMKDIETLVKSSIIGSELFAPEQLRGECEHFLSEIKRRLHDVEMNGFDAEEVASFTTITNHSANSLDVEVWKEFDQDELAVDFLIADAKTTTNHPADQAQERLTARVKTLAVSGNHVPRTPWEKHLFGATAPLPGAPVAVALPEDLYFDMHNAREFMLERLGTGWQTVASMEATCTRFYDEAKNLDASWWMDYYFLIYKYDGLVKTHLESCMLAVLPDDIPHNQSMHKALNACRLITTGDVVMSQEQELKDRLMAGTNLLIDLCAARGPLPSEAARYTDFLKRFLAKALNFAKSEVTEPGDEYEGQTFIVVGSEAVRVRYDKCKAMLENSIVSPEDIKFFRTFRWHLSAEQHKDYEEWERRSITTAKDRLLAQRQAALKDVEASASSQTDNKKKKTSKSEMVPLATPLVKNVDKSEMVPLANEPLDIAEEEAAPHSAEQASGLLSFFGSRAT